MTDSRLQQLKRTWEASGALEDEAAYLRERVRVGDLSQERLELAVWCGSEAGKQAFGNTSGSDWALTTKSLTSLGTADALAVTADLVAAAWAAIPERREDAYGFQRLRRISSHWSKRLTTQTAEKISAETSAPGLYHPETVGVDVQAFLRNAKDAPDPEIQLFASSGAAGFSCLAATWAAALGERDLLVRCLEAIAELLTLLRGHLPGAFRGCAPGLLGHCSQDAGAVRNP